MKNRLQELGRARGLDAIPPELFEVEAAPLLATDRWAEPTEVATYERALAARIRRGPEPSSTDVIETQLRHRPRELRLFALDTARQRLREDGAALADITAARPDDWARLVDELLVAPAAQLGDPNQWIERFTAFDLDAGWALAATDTGRALLLGEWAQPHDELVATLMRAHCPRWALAHALFRHAIGAPLARWAVAEILLGEGQAAAALAFAKRIDDDPAFVAYVAARSPDGLPEADAEVLIRAATEGPERVRVAAQCAMIDVAIDAGQPPPALPMLHGFAQKFPTWRYLTETRVRLAFALGLGADKSGFIVDHQLASFGVSPTLFGALPADLDDGTRAAVLSRLVREVELYPDWIASWKSLFRFAITDLAVLVKLERRLR